MYLHIFSVGCYRFTDGSLMRYFNYETNPSLRISAPIFQENDGNCNVWRKFKFIRDRQQWKEDKGSLFTITYVDKETRELKISSMENLRKWNGSLLKLTVSCRKDRKTESYCILLKLKSVPAYSEESPTKYSVSTQDKFPFTSSSHSFKTTSNSRRPTATTTTITTATTTAITTAITTATTTATTKNPLTGLGEERSEYEGTNTTVIAVTATVLLVALALALTYVVYYRRRKR